MTTTIQRIARQTAEDRLRLAAKAERQGVRILVDQRTGQHVATSANIPTGCYHVDVDGCSCRGFTFWGRCKHHSLLLAELGLIADEPSLVAGLSDADVIALKADAMRRHVLHGEPLVNVHTGELIAPNSSSALCTARAPVDRTHRTRTQVASKIDAHRIDIDLSITYSPTMNTKPRPPDCCTNPIIPLPFSSGRQEHLVSGFKALADPTRLDIFRLIAVQEAPICACDVVARFELTQPTISHHLKVLREAGLISVSRRGVWAYYAAEPRGLALLRGALDELSPVPLAAAG